MRLANDHHFDGLQIMSEGELANHIAIMMAADARHAPILRGSRSRRDQVDAHRDAFCKWVASRMLAHGMVAVMHRRSDVGG